MVIMLCLKDCLQCVAIKKDPTTKTLIYSKQHNSFTRKFSAVIKEEIQYSNNNKPQFYQYAQQTCKETLQAEITNTTVKNND